jgi:hypothetical protein
MMLRPHCSQNVSERGIRIVEEGSLEGTQMRWKFEAIIINLVFSNGRLVSELGHF